MTDYTDKRKEGVRQREGGGGGMENKSVIPFVNRRQCVRYGLEHSLSSVLLPRHKERLGWITERKDNYMLMMDRHNDCCCSQFRSAVGQELLFPLFVSFFLPADKSSVASGRREVKSGKQKNHTVD